MKYPVFWGLDAGDTEYIQVLWDTMILIEACTTGKKKEKRKEKK